MAVGSGESAAAYARRNNYSLDWSKWKSRRVRRLLGVPTLKEAVDKMGEAELEQKITGLERKLDAALDAMAKARTSSERESAREDVREVRSNLVDELRARGLSMKDLDDAAERKFGDRVDARVSAILKQRDDEAAAAAVTDDDEDDEKDKKKESKLDGLGGLRNRR